MTRELVDEDHAAAEVVERLAARFPTLPRAQIVNAVDASRRHFERARVRDFVPLLIEREARARLEHPL